MRVTSSMLFNQLVSSFRNGRGDFSALSERLATQKKLLAPSDDVMGAARAMDYRLNITDNGQYQRNIDTAATNLDLSNTVLTAVNSALSQVRSLLATAKNGTSDAGIQTGHAEQAGLLRDQLAFLANSKGGSGYLFSGFKTDVRPYEEGTFSYQGDDGVVNVPSGKGADVQANVPGSDVFSYTPDAPYAVQIGGGLNVHYTPGAGTTVDVEIRDAADTAVLDTFSFSNVMQMTDLLSSAIGANDTARMQALADPFNKVHDQAAAVQAEVGIRMGDLKDQSEQLRRETATLKDALSSLEDADLNETAMQLQQANTALQALYATSSKILQQSLFDFLK